MTVRYQHRPIARVPGMPRKREPVSIGGIIEADRQAGRHNPDTQGKESMAQSVPPSFEPSEPHPPPHTRGIDRSTRSLINAFRHAFAGVWYLLTTQRNAQIHCLIAACALTLGAFLGLARWEWVALVLIIVIVLAAEGMNTAIEAAVDVATSEYHPLARVAKDVAAGSVVLCALGAIIIGCLLFLPHLWNMIEQVSGGNQIPP